MYITGTLFLLSRSIVPNFLSYIRHSFDSFNAITNSVKNSSLKSYFFSKDVCIFSNMKNSPLVQVLCTV